MNVKFRLITYIIFLIVFWCTISSAVAANRTITVTIRATEEKNAPVLEKIGLYQSSHALVIGIDRYTNGWPALSGAINDAELVAAALKEKGFSVILKKNLNSFQLKESFDNFFIEKGSNPEARLFVWFAGHGHTLKGEGYLIPTDCPIPEQKTDFRKKALSMRRFGEYVRQADAKHAFAVFDSCFSGTIFTSQRSRPPLAVTRATTQPVRQFLSSGDADQAVSDNGQFRKLFLRAIRGEELADANQDGYITGSELGLFLSDRITNLTNAIQTPRYGKLRDEDYDRGDFVFVVNKTSPSSSSPTSVILPPNVSGTSFDDILESEQKTRQAKLAWQTWQELRNNEFIQIKQIEKSEFLESDKKIESLKRFLANLTPGNPYGTVDDQMRQYSTDRINFWKQQSLKKTPPEKKVQYHASIPSSKFIKNPKSYSLNRKKKIKIGLNLPFTGDIPKVGEEGKFAAMLWLDDIKRDGGLVAGNQRFNVELIFEDNASYAESAVRANTKMITREDVLAIIGPMSSKQAIPAGEVANKYKTVMISPWSTNKRTTMNRPFVFRGCFLDPIQGPVLVNFVAEEFGYTRAAVLYDIASDYPKGLAEVFKKAWEKKHGSGSVVAFESFTTRDTDFSAQLSRIVRSGAQVLFTPQYYNEVPLIVQQAKGRGFRGTIVGSDSWGSAETVELCGDACNGSFFATHYAAKGATGPLKDFIDRYKSKYGYIPSDVGALTFDSLRVLQLAIENIKGLTGNLAQDRQEVQRSLVSIKNYNGITGNMSYTMSGDPIKCAVIVKINNYGEYEYYRTTCPF